MSNGRLNVSNIRNFGQYIAVSCIRRKLGPLLLSNVNMNRYPIDRCQFRLPRVTLKGGRRDARNLVLGDFRMYVVQDDRQRLDLAWQPVWEKCQTRPHSKGRAQRFPVLGSPYLCLYRMTWNNDFDVSTTYGEGHVFRRSGTSLFQGAGPERSPVLGFSPT